MIKEYVGLEDQAAGVSLLNRAKNLIFVRCAVFVCKTGQFPRPPPPPGTKYIIAYTFPHWALVVYCRLMFFCESEVR
jgi:hypothetical protein